MKEIKEILSRRYDLSTFIIHLTRNFDGSSAKDNLKSILKSQTVMAKTPMGVARYWVDGYPEAENSQKCVSFSEAPLDQLWSFVEEIDTPRDVKFSKYGIVFPRQVARRLNLNPIWYIDKTPGTKLLYGNIGSSEPLNQIIESIESKKFQTHPISELTPLMDIMGKWGRKRKEFYWEREWRKKGDLNFEPNDIAFGLCPEEDIDEFESWVNNRLIAYNKFRKHLLRFVDPTWGLQEILAVLSGIDRSDFSPF